MTHDEIRIAVAECCEWKNPNHPDTQKLVENWWSKDRFVWWLHPDGKSLVMISDVPNYPASLDACAEFERTLTGSPSIPPDGEWKEYFLELIDVAYPKLAIQATPLQRCEAFLRVKGKWKEAKP